MFNAYEGKLGKVKQELGNTKYFDLCHKRPSFDIDFKCTFTSALHTV